MEDNNIKTEHWYCAWIKWGAQYKEQFKQLMEERGIKYIKGERRHYYIYTDHKTAKNLSTECKGWLNFHQDVCGNLMDWDSSIRVRVGA